jgi:PhoPQ-activated pathogenicity-related protein
VRTARAGYGWKAVGEESLAGGVTLHKLELTSQTWQGKPWTHRLYVVVPPAPAAERARPGHAIMLITGTGNADRATGIVSSLALQVGVPICALLDVPNQPLFEAEAGRGLKEDALIAYTFSKFLQTGDRSWPLLLPMTRSAVAAMDALGEWSQARVQAGGWAYGKLEKFLTTGASKRGWTTWLTGVADPRVFAIAPIVYDNLNIPAQLAHHNLSFGGPSESIHDYTELGLTDLSKAPPRVNELLEIVDPYTYAAQLTLPKLALFGTNDSYWPCDSVNLYRGAMVGDFNCHYVPNAGHSAGLSVVSAVAGFFDAVTGRIPALPEPRLTLVPGQRAARLELVRQPATPRRVRVWWAEAEGRDFRQARWESLEASPNGKGWQATVPDAALDGSGHAAFLGEIELKDSSGGTFLLHSPVQVWERTRQ